VLGDVIWPGRLVFSRHVKVDVLLKTATKTYFPLPVRRSASSFALRPPAAMKTERSLQGLVCNFLFFQRGPCKIWAVTTNIFIWNIYPVSLKKTTRHVSAKSQFGVTSAPFRTPAVPLDGGRGGRGTHGRRRRHDPHRDLPPSAANPRPSASREIARRRRPDRLDPTAESAGGSLPTHPCAANWAIRRLRFPSRSLRSLQIHATRRSLARPLAARAEWPRLSSSRRRRLSDLMRFCV
jgi:hypothetical protein